MSRKPLDLQDKIFGDLTAIARNEEKTGRNGVVWRCVCSCGVHTDVKASHLNLGKTKSCGCKKGELSIATMGSHGQIGSRLYCTWNNMKKRCFSEHPNYGGRGISVCSAWIDFDAFYDWAISSGYTDDLTIERIDVHKGYHPDNCTWIPMGEQYKNKTNTLMVLYQGISMTLVDFSAKIGMKYNTVHKKLKYKGYSAEEIANGY